MELKIEDLYFSYEQDWTLKDITFSLQKKNLTAILGPNGSGKSTLLKCINGLLSPARGSIELKGENLLNLPPARLARLIAYVPQQEIRKFPIPVFDMVLMGRKPHIGYRPGNEDREKTAEVIESMDLEDIAFRDFNSLSGGQQQKVLIARALVQEPDILLLDEPTSSLDLRNQLEVMEVIEDKMEGDLLALMAMHDLALAARYCERFIMLKEGRVHCCGGTEVINSASIKEVYGVEAEIRYEGRTPLVLPQKPDRSRAV